MAATVKAKPRHLLLATDLSARCDRARDRAIMLAREWNARLTLAHAVSIAEIPSDQPSRPAVVDATARAMRDLRADASDVRDVDVEFQVGEGRPEDVVLDIAAERGCDLIVTGIAGNDPLGQPFLGNSVAALLRRAAIPVLVVKKRAREPYRHVIIASDLSEPSAAALETALALFPPEQLALLNAFDMPLRSWVDDKPAYEHGLRLTAINEMKAFLAKVGGEDAASSIGVVAVQGDAAAVVPDHAARNDIDLVIAGTHGRTGFVGALLGSVAVGILNETPCDIMVVPAKGARGGN